MIETERLLLRPFIEKDAADVFEYLREPAVNCFASMKLDSLAEAKEEMKKRAGETEYYFAIVLKETGKVIGEIEAYPERGEPHDTSSPLDTFSPCWRLIRGKATRMKRHTLSLTISFMTKAQDASTPIPRITICQASTFVKDSVCAGKDCLWSSYPLSTTRMVPHATKTRCSMPF